jgi:glycosyltransferase involved in cell wall biosynthesis
MDSLIKYANKQYLEKNYEASLVFYRDAIRLKTTKLEFINANLELIKNKIGLERFESIWKDSSTKNNIKVSVICVTYNHEKYIRRAMEGFVSQKVNFKFEVLVGDDASQDSTKEIIQEYSVKYPDIIKPIYREKNIGSIRNWLDLFSRVEGEYVAINDGDDYWIDENKLQIQVDYLDKNKECAVCFHPVLVKQEIMGSVSEEVFDIYPHNLKNQYSIGELIDANFIQTNSVMYRWAFGKSLKLYFNEEAYPSDYYLHILQSKYGEIHSIPRVMSVYLKNITGVFSSIDDPKEILLKYGIGHANLYIECFNRFDDELKEISQRKINAIVDILVSEAIERFDCERLRQLSKWNYELVRNVIQDKYNLSLDVKDSDDIVEKFKDKVTISVMITSFNHKLHLNEAIKSVVDQNGFFRINIFICDDYSTDGSDEVIQDFKNRYPNVINIVPSYGNVGMLKNMKRGFGACDGEYVAICEGDDYWFSPFKLHKQWVSLAKNPNAMFCFNWSILRYDNGVCIPHTEQSGLDEYQLINTDYLYSNPITANFSSCFYRGTAIRKLREEYYEESGAADWLFNYLISLQGPGVFIKELLSVYRIHSGGQWSGMSKIKMEESIKKTKQAFHKYNEDLDKNINFSIMPSFDVIDESIHAIYNVDHKTFFYPYIHLDGWCLDLTNSTCENDNRFFVIANSNNEICRYVSLKNYPRYDVNQSYSTGSIEFVWSGFSAYINCDGFINDFYRVYLYSYDKNLKSIKYVKVVCLFELIDQCIIWGGI